MWHLWQTCCLPERMLVRIPCFGPWDFAWLWIQLETPSGVLLSGSPGVRFRVEISRNYQRIPVSGYAPFQRIEVLHKIVKSLVRRRIATVCAALAATKKKPSSLPTWLIFAFASHTLIVVSLSCPPMLSSCQVPRRRARRLPPLHPSAPGVPWNIEKS
jgi:hypothetical protein